MTDNEIINNIIWCIDPKNACADCPYYELRKSLDCVSSLFRDTLDLINRQKAELDQNAKEQHELMIEKDKMFDIAEKQKAEIERLRAECGNQSTLWSKHFESIFETAKETIKAEAIKELADKVHTEIHQALESNYKARQERMEKYINANGTDEFIQYCEGKIAALRGIDDFVDETYKEMVGDNE